jgi:hypothetical protein
MEMTVIPSKMHGNEGERKTISQSQVTLIDTQV